jgi:hypothetical protein
MTTIKLSRYDCAELPLWVNLQNHAFAQTNDEYHMHSTIRDIVSEYGGQYFCSTFNNGCIIFDDDEKASFFVLKFS